MFKRIFAVLGTMALLFALSGCNIKFKEYDYDGISNDFVVTGTVKEVNMTGFGYNDAQHTIRLDATSAHVESAKGDAQDWFSQTSNIFRSADDNFHFSNGYRDPRPNSWMPVYEDVGKARNADGYSLPLDRLKVGDKVHLIGRIHASKSGKTSPDVAVFHLIEVTGH